MPGHKLLGKVFASLQLCAFCIGTNNAQTGHIGLLTQVVDHTFHQWLFGANQHQIDLVGTYRFGNGGKVRKAEWQIGCDLRRSGIAGGHKKIVAQRALRQFPRKSMFPSPRAKYKYVHFLSFWLRRWFFIWLTSNAT